MPTSAQGYTSAAESSTGQPRAMNIGLLLKQGSQFIERIDRHFVIVTQTGVRRIHEATEPGGVDTCASLEHTQIFAHHMPGSATIRFLQLFDRCRVAHIANALTPSMRAAVSHSARRVL